jgi:homoserine kinase type II
MAELTKLSNEDFVKIATDYALEAVLRWEHVKDAFGNTNYHLWTSSGEYFVKVFGDEDVESIRYEIELQDYVSKFVPVALILRTTHDDLYASFYGKPTIVTKKADGEHLQSLNPEQLHSLAVVVATFHKALIDLRLAGREWDSITRFPEYLFGVDQHLDMELGRCKVDGRIAAKIPRQIIHADLAPVNILFLGNEVSAVLDWGDAHVSSRAYDIATLFVKFNLYDDTHCSQRQQFLSTYETITVLSREEKMLLPLFMKRRILSSIGWQTRQLSVHPDSKIELESSIKANWKKYETVSEQI